MNSWQSITSHIEQASSRPFRDYSHRSIPGGSINAAYLLESAGQRYFVKTNRSGMLDMFEAEARGLNEMSASYSIRVPKALCWGDDGTHSYIVLEYLDLSGRADQAQLGMQLADMHAVMSDAFGWHIDNTIGDTPQPNEYSNDWVQFWRDQRLGFQLQLAGENGYGGEVLSLGEKLLLQMPILFEGHDVEPSMLHGDLWGGNVAGLADGTPVIFDPAFYYGDREADLAMTYLFGGFGPDFYASYQNASPLDEGFALRKTFYNTYHILNHMNMFGGGYRNQAVNMMQSVLAEIS